MKIAVTADWHGNLPDVPECDLLLIAGDICPNRYRDRHVEYEFQTEWFARQFLPHMEIQPCKDWLMTPGNHDFVFESIYRPRTNNCLIDSMATTSGGLRVWGMPWTPPFCDWAFMAPEEKIDFKLTAVSCDILISHGPPAGPLGVTAGRVSAGSSALLTYVMRRQPRLMVCGHIHEGFGEQVIGSTRVINASLVDLKYRPVNPINVIDL